MTESGFFVILNKYVTLTCTFDLLKSWRGGRLTRGMLLLLVGSLGFWNIYTAQAQSERPADYVLGSSSIKLLTQPGAMLPVIVPVRNTTGSVWDGGQLQLGTMFSTGDRDRPSVWKTSDWMSDTRIGLRDRYTFVAPNQVAGFSFTMKAPDRSGWYHEYFQPMLNGQWLAGEPIVIEIQVGDVLQVQSAAAKEIRIYRKQQVGEWLENGYVVASLPISSGKPGYTTPAGKYTIINHFEEAYSQKYRLYMGHWMGLSKEGVGYQGYGLHSLAYWKIAKQPYPDGTIKNGRLYLANRVYEDVLHLGKPMSHGCMRFPIAAAEIMFNWAPDGTSVTVV